MNYGFVVTAKFDRKFSQKLQKFHNLWQNGRKLQRKFFYGKGPWLLLVAVIRLHDGDLHAVGQGP